MLNVVSLYLTDMLIRHIIIILFISVKWTQWKFCFILTNISRDHEGIKIWCMFSDFTLHQKMITFQAVVFTLQGEKLFLSEIWTGWTVNESSFHPSLLNKQTNKQKKQLDFQITEQYRWQKTIFLFRETWSDGIANSNHWMQIIRLQMSFHCTDRQWMAVTMRTVTSS